MKYCQNCRTYKNDESMMFCEVCRSQLIDVNIPGQGNSEMYVCRQCGRTYMQNYGACSFCNGPLVPMGGNGGASDEEQKKKKMIIIILAAVAAVLVLVLVGLLLHDHFKDKDDDKEPTTLAAEATMEDEEDTTKAAEETTTAAATTAQAEATTGEISSAEMTTLPVTTAPATTIPVITSPPTTVPPTTAPVVTQPPQLVAPVIRSAKTVKGTVLASSNVSSGRSFGADQAVDGNPQTCWCVNTSGSGGAGATIQFTLQGTASVNGIIVVNGNTYLPDEYLYQSNGQIKQCTLTFSDGSKKIIQMNYNYGSSQSVMIPFDAPVITSSITLTVNSAYVGQKYTTNVCLGEFDVY